MTPEQELEQVAKLYASIEKTIHRISDVGKKTLERQKELTIRIHELEERELVTSERSLHQEKWIRQASVVIAGLVALDGDEMTMNERDEATKLLIDNAVELCKQDLAMKAAAKQADKDAARRRAERN